MPSSISCSYGRVKNVKGQWKYLAQLPQFRGFKVQNFEIIHCELSGSPCQNDIDSPFGECQTTCKQIFSARKLVVVDENGDVSLDVFQLPSACLCKALTDVIAVDFRQTFGLPCRETSKLIQNFYGLEFNQNEMKSEELKILAQQIKPCENGQNFCSGNMYDHPEYLFEEVDRVMAQHPVYKNPAKFENLLPLPNQKSCQQLTQLDTGN